MKKTWIVSQSLLLCSLLMCGLAAAQPSLQFSSSGVSGNGQFDNNECNDFTVTVANAGATTATNISAVLAVNTPGVAVTQPASPYPDIAASSTATNSIPFQVST